MKEVDATLVRQQQIKMREKHDEQNIILQMTSHTLVSTTQPQADSKPLGYTSLEQNPF